MIAFVPGRRSLSAPIIATCLLAAVAGALAQTQPLAEEEATVAQSISDVPVFLGLDTSLSTSGRLHVVDADSLHYLGQIPTGLNAQMTVGPDPEQIFVASTYYTRGFRGQRTDVIEQYDRHTLALDRELVIPSKRALVAPMRNAMRISESGRWLYIQDFTPAASVTVVDLQQWRVASEIPNPGCFGIYPYPKGREGFATLCGDGAITTVDIGPDGSQQASHRSAQLFDTDADPWFATAGTDGSRLIFVSFKGAAHIVDLSGDVPEEVSSFSLIDGTDGNWRPGGYQLIAYHPQSGVLFVLMHPDGKEGSHKNTAPEIWAFNLASGKLLSRSKADDLDAITVSGSPDPVLHAVEPGGVYIIRYESDPANGYALDRENYEDIGSWMPHIEVVP